MSNTAASSEPLPDFLNPPLNEVVLGVQFNPPMGYQQIRVGEVWRVFQGKFPEVQEHPPLPPSFETFGLPQQIRPVGHLNFSAGAIHDRFWFLREDGEELIQFQQDRLQHNWRKVGDHSNEYPRFQSMAMRFHEELDELQAYFASLTPQALVINQCEISYINYISADQGEIIKPSDWLRFISFAERNPEDFAVVFHEVILDESGKPCARLICDGSLSAKADGQRIVFLNLTVRGAPNGSDIQSAVEFIARGHELIVRKFAMVTTEEAHKKWGRLR